MTAVPALPSEALERLPAADRLRLLLGLWPGLDQRPAVPGDAPPSFAVELCVDEQAYGVARGDDGAPSVSVGAPSSPLGRVAGSAEALWAALGLRDDTVEGVEGSAELIGWLASLGGETPAAALAEVLAARGPALSSGCLGRRFEGKSVTLSGEELRAFAEATSDDNPRFGAGDAELSDEELVAAPLFAVRYFNPMFFQVFADPSVKMDFSRLLFGEMEMRFVAPLRAGEVVVPEAETLSLEDKDTGQLLRVGVGLRVDGELRCSGVAGFFVRWKRSPFKSRDGKPALERLRLPSAAVELGEERFAEDLPIRDDQAKLFAAAANDPNPLHLDDRFAKMAGLPGVILHGLCSMAFCGRAVVRRLCDDDPTRLRALKVRFTKPARPGQTLTVRGFAPRPGEGDGVGDLYPFIALNDPGDHVITGGEATLIA